MIHIPIPSENCPKCRVPGGTCRMVITEISTLRDYEMKANEKDIRANIIGMKSPNYREAYRIESYVCLRGKGQ